MHEGKMVWVKPLYIVKVSGGASLTAFHQMYGTVEIVYWCRTLEAEARWTGATGEEIRHLVYSGIGSPDGEIQAIFQRSTSTNSADDPQSGEVWDALNSLFDPNVRRSQHFSQRSFRLLSKSSIPRDFFMKPNMEVGYK